jgi:L-iditol 2-dehydrogenase
LRVLKKGKNNSLVGSMRVAVYYHNKDVRVEEVPKPEIGPGEILVKTMASGICGSDVLEWYRIKNAPRVLGHEITGQIVEVGKEVENFENGERVFVSHHVPCNKCNYCLDDHHTACETLHKTNFYPGGFSEYIRVPKINVKTGTYRLPDNVSYEEGTFIEPLGCVIRGQRLAGIEKNQTVLVLGSGIAGLLHVKLAKTIGVKKLIATDIKENRLKSAKNFGADIVIDASEDIPAVVKKVNEKRLADRVILCTGAFSAVEQALDSVDRGGIILFFAVPRPGEDVCMITHKLSLDEIGEGFRKVAEADKSIKVIIEPYR